MHSRSRPVTLHPVFQAKEATARLVGVEMFAQDAEHLAHLFAFALEQGANLNDLLKMPFYHPTHEEVVRSALRNALDACAVKPETFGLEQFRCVDAPVDSAASRDQGLSRPAASRPENRHENQEYCDCDYR